MILVWVFNFLFKCYFICLDKFFIIIGECGKINIVVGEIRRGNKRLKVEMNCMSIYFNTVWKYIIFNFWVV